MFRKTVLALVCCAAAAHVANQSSLAAPGAGSDPVKRAEQRKKVLERFDKNRNGQLDQDERDAAKEAMQKRREQGGGQCPVESGARDPERRKKLLEAYDKDGDGKLGEEERAAAKQARAKRAG